MTLLCDIGNTFFHFWDLDGNECRVRPSELDSIKASKIYYISVCERHESMLLERFKDALNLFAFLELKGAYDGLGADRKAACIGAMHAMSKKVAIFDFGSAITIDFVDDVYLGGVILPGLRSYSQAFFRISSKLTFDESLRLDSPHSLPKSTHDGLISPVVEIINLYIQRALSLGLEVLFTGGDARRVIEFFPKACLALDLVYLGIKQVLRQHQLLRYDGAHE